MQQQQQSGETIITTSSPHTSSPNATPPRSTRLLYRRGLPDLPELIEAEEEEVVAADDMSMHTYSTRHSISTSTSSRDFPSIPTSTAPPSLNGSVPPSTPRTNPSSAHEIYTQTPPESAHQLQTPFDYVPSAAAFRHVLRAEEASPPPSPTARDEALVTAGVGYGLGVSFAAYGKFPAGESGMGYDAEYHEGGMDPEYGSNGGGECEGCAECAGFQHEPVVSGPYHRSSSSGEVYSLELGEYMSPPSSPGTDCMSSETSCG
jgi:hypothetical protein